MAYRFGELTPWTEGNAKIATEHNEPFGCVLLLQDILNDEGEVVARVEYLPCGSDAENRLGHLVLNALNSYSE